MREKTRFIRKKNELMLEYTYIAGEKAGLQPPSNTDIFPHKKTAPHYLGRCSAYLILSVPAPLLSMQVYKRLLRRSRGTDRSPGR